MNPLNKLANHPRIQAMTEKKVIFDAEYISNAGRLLKRARTNYFIKRGIKVCLRCQCEANVVISYRSKAEHPSTIHVDAFALTESHMKMMTLDHICPKSLGGKNMTSNYQLMCSKCNGNRGNILRKAEVRMILEDPDRYIGRNPRSIYFKRLVQRQFPDIYWEFKDLIDDRCYCPQLAPLVVI